MMRSRLHRRLVTPLPALLALATATAGIAAQETGRIVGRVSDVASGRPLSGAQVYLADPSRGGLTDLDGRFVLTGVPAGERSVVARMLGYGTKTVTGVEVTAGATATLDVGLETSAVEIAGITVSAERERGSTSFLLDQRRTSHAMVEAVGAAEIGRRPDSDAADVAKRMTGVTVAEGKYVFVRGLGERYSQTRFNGSSLPSPEPEKEVVPLDLIPASVLEALETQKSYTPEQPVDFSGGTVQIRTRDFPSDFTFKVGVGTSFNTRSQFKDGFLHYAGGGTDWIGLDDGTRAQPDVVKDLLGGVRSGQRLPADPTALVAIGRAFRGLEPAFGPASGSTPWNRSLDLSAGGGHDVFRDGELGWFVAGTYSDSYTRRDGEIERKWRTDGFREETAALATPNVDYLFDRGTRTVAWGGMANVTVKPGADHKMSLRTNVHMNTEDEARVYAGNNGEDIGGDVRAERSRFVERLLVWSQLSGEHGLFADSRLDWRLTGARAKREEPLMREAIYVDDGIGRYTLLDFTESARYFYSELVDDDASAEVDWRVPFGLFGRDASLKAGGAWRGRTRDFGARRLNWRFRGGTHEDLDEALAAATIVATSPRAADQFAIDEVVEPGDVYGVDDRRTAGYLMADLPLTGRLQAIVGARVGAYDLELTSRDSLLSEGAQTDVAPSVNLIFSATPDVKVRGAFSRTVDRPEFRELAPFQFTEATSLRQLVGNPGLRTADITSGDLRVDWFPGPGELVSVGGFYKSMSDPIEQVFIAAASSAYSFQNADEASILGLELDLQLALARLAEALEPFSFQANYSWIDSEVTVVPGGIFQPTHTTRALQGQAPYVVNLGLSYADARGLRAGLFFNRFGERIEAAGGSGLPDIFEQPRNALDASVGFPLPGGARAKLKATNLLDADYRFEQSANGITRIQRQYSTGRTFSIGLSWEF